MIGVSVDQILNYIHKKEEKEIQKSGRKDILQKFSSNLGLLTKAELKIALNTFNLTFTREQDNKADLLLILSKHLEKTKKSCQEFVEQFRY